MPVIIYQITLLRWPQRREKKIELIFSFGCDKRASFQKVCSLERAEKSMNVMHDSNFQHNSVPHVHSVRNMRSNGSRVGARGASSLPPTPLFWVKKKRKNRRRKKRRQGKRQKNRHRYSTDVLSNSAFLLVKEGFPRMQWEGFLSAMTYGRKAIWRTRNAV